MKRPYTAILFACALCMVIVALILTQLAQNGYDDYTDPQDSSERLISARDFANTSKITGIIVHLYGHDTQDGQYNDRDYGDDRKYIDQGNVVHSIEDDYYVRMQIHIEDRSDIQVSNLNCRGESVYKAEQMQFTMDKSTLHITLKEDTSIGINNACSTLSLTVPDNIQTINLSALDNGFVTLSSDSTPQQLSIITSLSLEIAGQYQALTVWQLWQEETTNSRGYYNTLDVATSANIKTLTYYSRNLHVNIDAKAHIESGVLYGDSKGSFSIYDLELLNKLRFHALQTGHLQQMVKFLNN